MAAAGRETAGQIALDGGRDVTDYLVPVELCEGADPPDVACHGHADQLGGDEPGYLWGRPGTHGGEELWAA